MMDFYVIFLVDVEFSTNITFISSFTSNSIILVVPYLSKTNLTFDVLCKLSTWYCTEDYCNVLAFYSNSCKYDHTVTMVTINP